MGELYDDLVGLSEGITQRVQEGFYGGLSRNFKPISTILGIAGLGEAVYLGIKGEYASAIGIGVIGLGTILGRNRANYLYESPVDNSENK
jgi:hypothetical protein